MQVSMQPNTQTLINIARKPRWHVVYVRPHHEKMIAQRLQEEQIDVFLPLRSTLKQWSDRKKKVTEPLFSCYLFVNITLREYYKILNVPGVIKYVCFEGKAATIPEIQIQTIKNLLNSNFELEETPVSLKKGNKVRIIFGSLKDIDGELIMYKNRKRVLIRIEEINKSLFVNVPLEYLKLVG
jgi:transcription antitermination factor NusG